MAVTTPDTPIMHGATGVVTPPIAVTPFGAAANVVVGGVADLGSIAAYPFYCFPRYGSCPFYRPYP